MARGRVAKITPEQEALLPAARESWVATVRSTEPADRPRAERAVLGMYQELGEPQPMVIWLDSPLAGAVGAELIRKLLRRPDADGDQLGRSALEAARDQLRSQLGDQLGDKLRDQLEAQLLGQRPARRRRALPPLRAGRRLGHKLQEHAAVLERGLRPQLESQLQLEEQGWEQLRLWGQHRLQLWRQLQWHLGDPLWAQLLDQLGRRHSLNWRSWVSGRQHAFWVAYYDFARQWGVRYEEGSTQRLALWVDYVRSAAWMWPLRGAVILTERPMIFSQDEEGRLHSDTGPAVRYPDGWTTWAVHGVRVPERVITGDFAAQDISTEANVEVRRVMLERFGAERYLRETGARLKHEDEWGRLWRLAQEGGDEDLVLVEVVNATAAPDGTYKNYWMRVPPETRTARAAVAWTFDVAEDDYEPVAET